MKSLHGGPGCLHVEAPCVVEDIPAGWRTNGLSKYYIGRFDVLPVLFTTVDQVLLGEVAGVTFGVCLVDEGSNISFGHAIPLFTQSPSTAVFGDLQ